MSKSNFKTLTHSYNVKGSGETEAKAVEETFKNLRQEIGAKFDKPVISIRTTDYIINDLIREEKQESYLYVFMKRTRIKYVIDVTIEVEIDYADIKGGS